MRIFYDVRILAILIPGISAAPWEIREAAPPAPLVVPPSQYWDGDDGAWSSFALRVGTPAQDVRLLVSTNAPQTMVVVPRGCTTEAINPLPSDCANSRGGLFNSNQSSTWINLGDFGINQNGIGFEANLGYSVNADYGLETLGLGFSGGASGPTLQNQTVAAIAAAESPFYLGIFGLNTQPVTTVGNFSVPSFFTSLRSQHLIPSLSWSYTAGAKYRLKDGQYAQLIIGGYDSSRFASNSASFTLAGDIDRDIVVGIHSITYTGTTETVLLSTPIYAFIESTDPNIWLPEAACQEFERAFGISMDDSTGLYLINSTQYAQLQALNPQVTFTIGDSLTGGETVNVVLPIGALALPASYPFTSGDTYYFPLKKAANDSQITLGRAFLQEAYLMVDYERGNFSVSQCVWVDDATPQIESILSSSYTAGRSSYTASRSSSTSPASNSTTASKGLAPGVVAAIVIVAVLLIVAISGLAYYFLAYQRMRAGPFHRPGSRAPQDFFIGPVPPINSLNNPEEDPTMAKFPDSTTPKYKAPAGFHEFYQPKSELPASREIFQLPNRHDSHEGNYFEAADSMQSQRTAGLAGLCFVYELEGSIPEPHEMDNHTSQGALSPLTEVLSPVSNSRLSRNTFGRQGADFLHMSITQSPLPVYTFLDE